MPLWFSSLLFALVRENGVASYNKYYEAKVYDGTQLTTIIRAAGLAKHIRCNNHFPDGIVALHDFLFCKILSEHVADIENANVNYENDQSAYQQISSYQ